MSIKREGYLEDKDWSKLVRRVAE